MDISGEPRPKYQWAYDGNESNVAAYGRLYTWYAVTDSSNICPTGWHVPTDDEWHTLVLYLDSSAVLYNTESIIAGGKMKESGTTHWLSPNTEATNESGFTALPGGYRYSGGQFQPGFFDIGVSALLWSSTLDGGFARNRIMAFGSKGLFRNSYFKNAGLSVRCIKD